MSLTRDLEAVVGAPNVLVDADLRAGYEVDWTGRFRGRACAVVRPGDAAEVAGVLRACASAGVAVVPQGGNTGLVGGGVPRDGAVVLSTSRLTGLEVDAGRASVRAGAGVRLAQVQAVAASAGLAFGVDLAARDSATVGGMVATDAGGLHAVRHGPMRRQLLGVQAVLADGSIVERLDRLQTAGYDLAQLVAGSEGTLAVITAVRLALVAADRHRAVALVGVDGPAAAVALAGELRAALPSLSALEVFHHDGVELVCRHGGLPLPLPRPAPTYVLAEAAGDGDPLGDLAALLGQTDSSAVADDGPGRDRLWSYRELHTAAIASLGVPHKLDVALPLGRLADFERDVRVAIAERWPGATVVTFGHLGLGHLHVNVVGPDADDAAVDDMVLGMVVAAGGSVSAEHGIGVAKRRWAEREMGPVERDAMRAVKRALDPGGVLNPGVLLAGD